MADTLFDKYQDGKLISNLDKDHSQYRAWKFRLYMTLREKEFINSFTFSNDETFTRAKQRTLAKLCFRYGYAGLINVPQLLTSNMHEATVAAFKDSGIDTDAIIRATEGDKIPVAVFPYHWNTNELPTMGTSITIPKHNIGTKSYAVTDQDTAFLTYDDNYLSGYWWWMLPAYIYATGKTVLKKRLTLLDGKLVQNDVNNTYHNGQFDQMFSVENSFINLSPAQTSMSGDDDNFINVENVLSQKLKKLDFSQSESINEILDFINEHERTIFWEMGKRINMNEPKNERSISQDFESLEIHYTIKEKELKDMLTIFCEHYQQVFGTKLDFSLVADEVKEELKAQEIAKAGHGLEGGENGGSNLKTV